MNKGIVIGIIVAIVIVIVIGAASSLNLETPNDVVVDEIKESVSSPIEEEVLEPKKEGRNLTVEIEESVALTSP